MNFDMMLMLMLIINRLNMFLVQMILNTKKYIYIYSMFTYL